MKNLTNAKKVLVMVIMVAIMLLSTNVFAADEGWASLDNVLTNSTNGTGTSGGNALSTNGTLNGTTTNGTGISNTSTLNTTSNLASNTAGTTTLNVAANNTASTNNNTSAYTNNSKNLPDTGLQDSLPMLGVVSALIVSAVYAYKKVKDYQNL